MENRPVTVEERFIDLLVESRRCQGFQIPADGVRHLLRRAVQIAYGMKELPGPEELEKLAEEWRPHRTLTCLYLWRSLDNTPVETPAK